KHFQVLGHNLIQVEHLGSEHLFAAEGQQLPGQRSGALRRIGNFLRRPAMPPANRPMASIFCAWRSCSSSVRVSVTSSIKISKLLPFLPFGIERPEMRATIDVPSRRTHSVVK